MRDVFVYCLKITRVLKQQMEAEAKREKAVRHAQEKVNSVHKARKELGQSEYLKLWNCSPFQTICSVPQEPNIFSNVPNYAQRFGELTSSYLECVRRANAAVPHSLF